MSESSKKKIVLMGGGSTLFAPAVIVSFIRARELYGSTLVLVDIDARKLNAVFTLGQRLIEVGNADYTLERTTDRESALVDADYVITSVEVDRFKTWEQDRAIPEQFGIRQSLGENGGPGGLMHAMRQIPLVVEICQDVERICPDAWVLNLANPMSRILQGINDHTNVKFMGICHEIIDGGEYISSLLAMPEERIHIVAAGLNHFTWFLKLSDKETGEDLYPKLRKAVRENVHMDRLLVADLLRVTGFLTVTSDSHVGEYLAEGHLLKSEWAPHLDPLPFFDIYKIHVAGLEEKMQQVISGQYPAEEFLREGPPEILGEIMVDVINKLIHGDKIRFNAFDIPNNGCISNMPSNCVVEVPAWIDRGEIRGEDVGPLPPILAGWCNLQATIHSLNVKAAIDGDRQAALDAMMLDPVVPDRLTAEKCLDAMLEANREYLPRFFS
jgi:alpha-galactosidase